MSKRTRWWKWAGGYSRREVMQMFREIEASRRAMRKQAHDATSRERGKA